jgi:ribonuclease HI
MPGGKRVQIDMLESQGPAGAFTAAAGFATPVAMDETLTLQFDGGSRGNPGPAGIGVVVAAADGTPLVTLGRYIGRATNNVAEYKALITALAEAKKLDARNILIRGDSELIIKQMCGEYRVKNPDLKLLYNQAQALLRQFADARFEHNLRHKNVLADKLANLAMDRRADVTEVDSAGPMTDDPPSPPPAAEAHVNDRLACPRCKCTVMVVADSLLNVPPGKGFICQCGTAMKLEMQLEKP